MNKLSPRQEDALDRIQEKPVLQPFFFRKINGLKWFDELKNRGFFDPAHNPTPVEVDEEGYFRIPTWPVMEYLKRTAPELQTPGNEAYSDEYLAVLRGVTSKAIEDGTSNYRTWLCFVQILEFISIDKLSLDDVEFIRYWLADKFDRMLVWTELARKLFPRLLSEDSAHSRQLAVAVLRELTLLVWRPTSWGAENKRKPVLQVDDYWAREVFSAHAKSIGEKLEADGANVLRERLIEIFEGTTKGQYSTIWRPAIEDHDQNRAADETPGILVSAFRDSVLGYVERRAAAAADYVEELINSEFIVFKRIAIFVVRSFSTQLQHLVPQFIDPKWIDHQYLHEVYGLFETCVSSFDKEQIGRLIDIIQDYAKQNRDAARSEEIQNEQEAYAALRWLSAVRGRGSKEIDGLYAHYLSITKADPEHPDFSTYTSSLWVGDKSPFSVEELLSRSFPELVELLQTFEESGEWKSPTQRGLSLVLKDALKAKPEFFEGNLSQLIGIHHDYTCQLIDGYRDLWKDRQYDNWKELLEFCMELLYSKNFWPQLGDEQPESMVATYRWVVGAVAELIRAGTVDDASAFDQGLLPVAREILEYALDRQDSADFSDRKDAVSAAINSARGKCIEALFNYALRCCRIADAAEGGHETVWEKDLRPLFDREIDRLDDGNLEFATLFANYIPNLLYLSRKWTIEKLPTIFLKSDRDRWVCAMQGYTYVNQIYPDVYQYLREHGHIMEALDSDEFESRGKDKLIQNVVIQYLGGKEELGDKDGLLFQIIDRWRYEEIRELIWFIWTLRDGRKSDYRTKVLDLWVAIDKEVDKRRKNDQRILAHLCSLSTYVEELNEVNTNLLLRSAPFVEMEHDSYILVEQLRRLVDTYPNPVADIFIQMLEVFAPTYQQENIEYILKALFESGGALRQKANTIFDKYVEHGVLFAAELRASLIR